MMVSAIGRPSWDRSYMGVSERLREGQLEIDLDIVALVIKTALSE